MRSFRLTSPNIPNEPKGATYTDTSGLVGAGYQEEPTPVGSISEDRDNTPP